MLSFTRRAFFGAITHANVEQLQDRRPRELALLCVPALLVLLLCFMPNKVLKINQKTAEVWLNRLVEQPLLEINEEKTAL
jgi:NADH-quinone oxidoreductase subunit M